MIEEIVSQKVDAFLDWYGSLRKRHDAYWKESYAKGKEAGDDFRETVVWLSVGAFLTLCWLALNYVVRFT